ncbi:hypothetical protein AnigIFM56816_002629 [Aspergillus niger]|uniref:Contig An02c0270, genomic contig n=2 Tax=Aspergillus niger TaxID=5061 RepID=A2QDZ8_ASPNC|nr:uncharacterized protein An02g08845 [Aspergillus niger]GKZ78800.1 hypothetical protein AnigIFM56816_002629 [Aspergillus niger]GLA22361.1 hypothetical protein AnigIFM63326_003273 [Aspergillus niger]GLA51342.1 hypothetical protein AnigIFM63604_007704 [Aspergillus niger]CAK44294.1 unnamed protein product [Aspergillus niger]
MMLDKRSPYRMEPLPAKPSHSIVYTNAKKRREASVPNDDNSQYKSWKVTGLLPWSALLFTAGFITRTIGAFGQWGNVGIYIASTVLLLAAPPVYEGANYFTLGRILYYIPYHSPIHPGRVFTTFVAVGVVIEAITGNGAALVANSEATEGKRKTGEGLLKAALILQLVLMAAFVALAARFHYNCSRGGVLNHKIKRAFGNQISPILKDEWFFWVFEAGVMYLNTILLNVCHPMQWLPRSNKIYLATDGVTEIEGPGYDDHRPVILTLIDPFDIVGLIKNKVSKVSGRKGIDADVFHCDQPILRPA